MRNKTNIYIALGLYCAGAFNMQVKQVKAAPYNQPQLEREIIYGFNPNYSQGYANCQGQGYGDCTYYAENGKPVSIDMPCAETGTCGTTEYYEQEEQNNGRPADTVLSEDQLNKYYVRLNFGFNSMTSNAEFRGSNCSGSYDLYLGCNWDKPETFLAGTFEDTLSIGGGFGINFANFLRADVTFTKATGMEFEEDINYELPELYFDTDCTDGYCDVYRIVSGKLDTYTFMASAYFDIGKKYEYDGSELIRKTVVPYVGLGVGFSFNKLYNFYTEGEDSESPYHWSIDGETTKSMAMMYTFGVGFALGKQTTLDVNMKYMDLGEAKTSNYVYNSFDGDYNNDGIYDSYQYKGSIRFTNPALEADLKFYVFSADLRFDF